jgi:hypothetical protein
MVGDSVQALADLAFVLVRCASVYRHEGELERARIDLVEAAEHWRAVQLRCGELPQNAKGLVEVLEELRGVQDEIAGLGAPE